MKLDIAIEKLPLARPFRIARGMKTEAVVVVARLSGDGVTGAGECVPYARYGESVEGVADTLSGLVADVRNGLDRAELQTRLPAGAARNALDCAFWQWEARRAGLPVWKLAGLEEPRPVASAVTLSLDEVDAMAAAARAHALMPVLKLKLAGAGDLARVRAVRANAPKARLVVDANEGWDEDHLRRYAPAFAALGVTLIEQPLKAGADGALADFASPVPIAADEACHDRASLPGLVGKYEYVNIKLDKAGGLTEALALAHAARAAGFRIMVGCMVASSLSMAPALLLAQLAELADLDGPLWLKEDRAPAMVWQGAAIHPASPDLWG